VERRGRAGGLPSSFEEQSRWLYSLLRSRAAASREKEHTRLGDELARQRRELPWVAVQKEYRNKTCGERGGRCRRGGQRGAGERATCYGRRAADVRPTISATSLKG
jgi:Bacterial protein of unknown function (DUF899)